MVDNPVSTARSPTLAARLRHVPPFSWLSNYDRAWLPKDIVAGITLAAYAIPVSLAYAALAGLPPQVGVYGYLLGGLGYALLGSSRQLAVGPTSAISLMIAASVGVMADGDMQRYLQIASLAAFTVAVLVRPVLALAIERDRAADQRLDPGRLQDRRRAHHRHDAAAGSVRRAGRRTQFLRARLYPDWTARAGAASRACDRRDRDRAAAGRREMAAGPAGRAFRRGARHRLRDAARAAGERRADHRRDPARIAEPCDAGASHARCRGHLSARGRAFCCSPMSRAYPRAGPLPPSMATRSTCARNFLASARPISRPRSAMAIRSRAGCRNRRSTTRRARRPRSRWSSLRSRSRFAFCI